MATATSMRGGGLANAFDAVAASATDSVLVAAQADTKIRVRSFLINHGDTTSSTVTFNSKGSGAGTAISPAFKAAPNALVQADNPEGWFETLKGEGLTVTTSAGSTTGIVVVFERTY